jgi:hypothetical protein
VRRTTVKGDPNISQTNNEIVEPRSQLFLLNQIKTRTAKVRREIRKA